MTQLPAESAIAFKEWAAVCAALAAGRQTIILRKGGIDEGRDGFRVLHPSFWLYPTNFHQTADALTPDAATFANSAAANRPPAGKVPLQQFAVALEVHELATENAALRLTGLHCWSEATIRQRFAYRRSGLFLLVVRVFVRPEPALIGESPEMAGCKSWVSLTEPLATTGLTPVLSDDAFAKRLAAIHAALA